MTSSRSASTSRGVVLAHRARSSDRRNRPIVTRSSSSKSRSSESSSSSSSSSSTSSNAPKGYSNETKLRSEAQAPFRVARQFVYGACATSATIGFGIATIQFATGALGAPSAPPLETSLSNGAIDFASLAFFGYLYAREDAQRAKQMARIGREERLGRLKMELVGGKTTRVEDVRGFARCVVVAGDEEYVRLAICDAEAVREKLLERGVLVVAVVTTKGVSAAAPGKEDRKFRATPLRVDEWIEWVNEQKSMANVGESTGVYVGLRMDGRVRTSGTGRVPFERFAVELPPVDGWGGALDGFDGRVGVDS